MTPVAVAVDVGGTKIAGALVSADGDISHHTLVPTPRSDRGADPGSAATAALVDQLLARARVDHLEVAGVGIGVPEYVDNDGNIASQLVLAWDDEPAATFGGGAFRIGVGRVLVQSDVRCGAVAEAALGHGRGVRSCLYVSLGTGISHTFVMDGRIWSGHRGEAIALGQSDVVDRHLLRPDAAPTLEAQASGHALEQIAAQLEVDPRDLGSEQLHDARRRAGRMIGRAIANTVGLLDPEVVVLGGGLGTSAGAYADAIREQFEAATSARPHPPPLLRSALGASAGTIGAGLLVFDRSRSSFG